MNLEEIKKYDTFIYNDYKIEDNNDNLKITYYFSIPNLGDFIPSLEIPKKTNKKIDKLTEYLVFHIGLVELISYWKCTISKNVIIKCGNLNEEQKNWFKKLYFYGLGEFFYTNNISPNLNDFMNITCFGKEINLENSNYQGEGVMIPIGGGKDSCVSLELLKNENVRKAFIINSKEVMKTCANLSGIEDKDILKVKRNLDLNIVELNKKGFLNGHTPFSSMVAFVSFLTAYLNDLKDIALSNESSANESNINNTKINHQYSKSFEFEKDFNNYVHKYFKIDINYFSFLRPISEYQIGYLLSKMPKYHSIFKSCNVGSKERTWKWCNNCSKCLFVYSMLSPFLYKEELIDIFKEDLFEKKDLLETFKDLLGYGNNKPFDCVGTYEEINYAISKTIKKLDNLPYLLEYYKNNYELKDGDLEHFWNNEHNLNSYFETILKGAINND